MKLPSGYPEPLFDQQGLISRDMPAPTPVADGALGDPKGARQLRGSAGFFDGESESVHAKHSAPQVHQVARAIMHRHQYRPDAQSWPMEVLILTETDHRKAVGVRLRRLIYAAGLNQVEASKLMGVPKNHLGNWLRGEAYPRHYPLYKFCRATGVTADFVLLGDPSGLPKRVVDEILSAELAPLVLSGADHPEDESQ